MSTARQKKPFFELKNVMDLINNPDMKEPSFRVEGLLTEEGTSLWAAKPKVGKSVLLSNLVASVIEGCPFLGRQTYPCDAGFIAFEGSDAVFRCQMQRLGVKNSLGVLHYWHSGMLANLRDRWAEILRETLDKFPNIRLLVIDPITKLLQPRDNDNYIEIQLLMARMEAIARERHIHIACSAHEKKRGGLDRGDGIIGSTGYRAAADTNVFITKQGTQRQLSTEQRWGTPIEDPVNLTFDADAFRIGLGRTVTELEQDARERKERSNRQRIEKDLRDALLAKSLPTVELLAAVKGNQAQKYEILTDLEGRGLVKAEQDGRAIVYSLSEFPTEKREEIAA
jgi:DNA-binding transcriptional ArsR family regulator